MAIYIRIGTLNEDKDARLFARNVSGEKFELAGVARKPYVRNDVVLDNFEHLLEDGNYYFLVRTSDLISRLAVKCPAAERELAGILGDMDFFPFPRKFCRIILRPAEKTG